MGLWPHISSIKKKPSPKMDVKSLPTSGRTFLNDRIEA